MQKATQTFSVAVGNDIGFTAYAGTAVGQQACATGDVSTAIGTMTNVDADYNATHDDWRKAGYQSTAIGAYSGSWGIASTALGGYSRADEKFATAVGYGSHATAESATTLGAKAEANAYESVAIGAFSVADRESGAVGAFAPEGADSLTWKANRGAVSVGSSVEGKEITRQITNVAAGSEATDAVNVAQLKAATENAGWNLATNGVAIEATKVKPGDYVDFSGDKNIIISNDGTNVQVKLNEAITAKTVTTGNTVMNSDGVKVGADVSLNQNGLNVGKDVSVTATAVTAGKTSISDEGVKVGDKTYINDKGLNANGQNITNVADGKVEKDSKDAINGGQLHQAKADINNRIDGVENQVVNNTNRINKLGSRVNKVGAGAAALAALHPMDFDPDDKLTFSAGYGNYGGENAAAIGAYYRPDEKVMFSVAGTVGNGENMVNAGVSFALDRTNHVSNSRTALAREVIDLRGQLAVMGAKMAKMEKAFGMLDETKTKLFPDVPANHWAYEYIAKLAGNGYIEGYPDGNFGGDRLMTRYEFAAMLYRAIENGAALEEKIIKEFEPELGRIRVDRISGEDGDRDKIERVRVNDTKGERDHYGNKLAK